MADIINQLPNFDAEPDKKELKELLAQLQNIVLQTKLENEDKQDTFQQIKAIASCLTNSLDSAAKKTAKRGMKMLRVTAATLPPSASMVTVCDQLPELINKIF